MANTVNNVGRSRTTPGSYGSGQSKPGTKTVVDLMGKKQPEGPLASKDRVQTWPNGLDKGRKITSAQLKTSKPDENVKAEMKKHGQKYGSSTLAEAAKKLYPSAK